MIDPSRACLFIPGNLKKFKLDLFNRIGSKLGRVVLGIVEEIENLPSDWTPIVGCSPELTDTIARWRNSNRQFVYWDRGYARRVFATWLPRGDDGGYYRWHVNSYQMKSIRAVSSDRWEALRTETRPWQKQGRHIVVAHPTPTYARFHGLKQWTDKILDDLSLVTDRQIVVRTKESKRSLASDLEGAHCLVAHASNAAVEAVILGCPVFVDPTSAAALVGRTDLQIEKPSYPDRQPWLNSLAYCQFNEKELIDGTLWRLLA